MFDYNTDVSDIHMKEVEVVAAEAVVLLLLVVADEME